MKMRTDLIAELMMKQGETQTSLAQKSGVSRQTISAILTGRRLPTVAKVSAIAQVLNVSIDELMDFTEKKEPFVRNTLALRNIIKEKMSEKGIANAETLCHLIGYDNSDSISRLLDGKISWFPDVLSAVLQTLEIKEPPVSPKEKELLLPAGSFAGDGAMLVRPIPVVDWANAASSLTAQYISDSSVLDSWDACNTETVLIPAGNRDITIAFRINGVSMEPTLFDNDVILVERKMCLGEIPDKKVVVVKFGDDFPDSPGVVCKRLRRYGDTITLTSDNPAGDEYEITEKNRYDVEWVAQVVQVQSNRNL